MPTHHERNFPQKSIRKSGIQPAEASAAQQASLRQSTPNGLFQRGLYTPAALRPSEVLHLQQTVGNRTVSKLLQQPRVSTPVIQAKRSVERLRKKQKKGQLFFKESGNFYIFEDTKERHISVPKPSGDTWDEFHVTYTKDPIQPSLGDLAEGKQPHIYFTDEPKLDTNTTEKEAGGQNWGYRNAKARSIYKGMSNTQKRNNSLPLQLPQAGLNDTQMKKLWQSPWNTIVVAANIVAREWCKKLDSLKITRQEEGEGKSDGSE